MLVIPTSIKQLHILLRQVNLLQHKKDIVSSFTNSRTDSSKEMYEQEAQLLIAWLKEQDNEYASCERMRRKIISMARELGWEIIVNGQLKADLSRINQWCKKYGYLHKELNKYKCVELTIIVSQFEKVYKDSLTKL